MSTITKRPTPRPTNAGNLAEKPSVSPDAFRDAVASISENTFEGASDATGSLSIEASETHTILLGPDDTQDVSAGAAVDGDETFGKFAEGHKSGGILIKPGDEYKVHPVAQSIRRSKEQRQALADDLRKNGQLCDVLYVLLPDGTKQVIDGVGRLEIGHAKNEDVAAHELTKEELKGRSIEQFIFDMNTAVGGRKLSDVQRAMMAYTCCLSVTGKSIAELKEEARDRKKAGKKVEGEKGTPAAILAEHAKVNESKMRSVIDLAIAEAPSDLLDAVWNGFAISSAVKLARLTSASDRQRGVTLAKSLALSPKDKAKKAEVKKLLGVKKNIWDQEHKEVPELRKRDFERAHLARTAIKSIRLAILALNDASVDSDCMKTFRTGCDSIEDCLPHAVCPNCGGMGCYKNEAKEVHDCPTCETKGILTKREYNTRIVR